MPSGVLAVGWGWRGPLPDGHGSEIGVLNVAGWGGAGVKTRSVDLGFEVCGFSRRPLNPPRKTENPK